KESKHFQDHARIDGPPVGSGRQEQDYNDGKRHSERKRADRRERAAEELRIAVRQKLEPPARRQLSDDRGQQRRTENQRDKTRDDRQRERTAQPARNLLDDDRRVDR